MVGELFSIVAPVYLCAAIGFMWIRLGRRFDTELLTDLIFYIGTPCLTFSSLVGQSIHWPLLVETMGAAFAAVAALGLVAAIVLSALRLPLGTYLAPLTFGNTGNMGLPICFFAFGAEGLALGVCFFAVTSFLQFTVGQAIWSGEFSFASVVRSPLVWSVVLALGVVALGLTVPEWIMRTTTLLGGFTIPLMQLTLGVSLAQLEVRSLGRTLVLAIEKTVVGALIGLGVAEMIGLEGMARGVLVIQCAMPVAVFNYMFATRYDRSPANVASLIVVSTFLALATTPIVLGFVLP